MHKAKARLGILKVYQNNFKEAKRLFSELKKESPDWRDRTYASHWIQRLSRYSSDKLAMLNCGTQALAYLLEKDGRNAEARKVIEMLPESLQGHSLYDLSTIASQYGYNLEAVKLSVSDLSKLPLPSIMHVNAKNPGDNGHYWILEKVADGAVELFDPQAGRRFQQSVDEFSKEWSGNALAFFNDKMDTPGTRLTENETQKVYGGCCGVRRPETDLGRPCQSKGEPAWSVNVVNMNLYVNDTPLWYGNPIGPSVEISLSYNSQSAIANNEPFGNKWQFNYASYLVVDTGGQVTIFMPDGRRDIYSPDGSGGYVRPYQMFNTLTKIAENHFELRSPNDTVYVYNIPPGTTSLQPFLIEIRNAHGQKLSFKYNANVQLTTITDALGKVTTLTYNADGLVTQVADPFGRSALFEYNAERNLTKITDMGGYWSRLTYDSDVYLTSIENAKGKWDFYIEPADGDPGPIFPSPGGSMWENYRITITNPLDEKEEYFYSGSLFHAWYISPGDYMPWGQSISNYDDSVQKTKYFFSETSAGRGNIVRTVYPGGEYVMNSYDSNGNKAGVVDSHGHKISYTYNNLGRITSITDAKNITTEMTYAPNGVDLLEINNGLGIVAMTYNNAHDIKSITDRLGTITEFTYNGYGQVLTHTDAKGAALETVTAYSYYGPADAAKYLLKEVKRDGQTLGSFTYDAIGRVKTGVDATGLALTYDYNDLNNITKITYPDGKFTSSEYSSCCPYLLDSMTDRSGRNIRYKYDALKRLVETVNPEGGSIRSEYDADGNLIKFIDSNSNATTFMYDQGSRLIKKTYADGKHVSFKYDKAGLLSSVINARGITISYVYDENHNIKRTVYSDSITGVIYQYDDYNRVTQRIDGIGAYQFTYDANSQLKTVDGPWDNDTLTYHYDALGRRTSLTPQNGRAVSYTYDNLNRLTGIQTGSNTYSYSYINANPLVQSLTRPNASITTYQYDALNRLTEISNKNSSSAIINKYVYGYDPLKDVRSSETVTNGNPITSFQNELITYNYNKVNQLLSSTNPAKVFTYDDDGNMTQGYTPEGHIFTAAYDAENRLKSIEYTDGGGVVHKTEYLYSADNFLAEMKKYEDGLLVKTKRYVRDGFLPLQDRNAGNNIVREYVWGQNMGGGIGGLLNITQGGEDYSYLYDGKGNVTALIDSFQTISATYTYDTFGNLMAKTGTLDQPYQFSTKPYDEKTGLSYYGYRFYSPTIGRWINRDPLGEKGGINLYGFVGNNPVNWVDSMGLQILPAEQVSIGLLPKDKGKNNPSMLQEWKLTFPPYRPPKDDCVTNPNQLKCKVKWFMEGWKKGSEEANKLWQKKRQELLNQTIQKPKIFSDKTIERDHSNSANEISQRAQVIDETLDRWEAIMKALDALDPSEEGDNY
jgi:RHS repeat-associated protein